MNSKDKISNPPTLKDAAGIPMFTWRGEVTVKVSGTWVADGFDMNPQAFQDCIEDAFNKWLGYAREDEVKLSTRVTKSPPAEHVQICQGYMEVPEGKAWDPIRNFD